MKLDRMETFAVKNHALYKCRGCGETSEVVLSSDIYKFLWITQILAVLVFGTAMFLGGQFLLIGLGIQILIFGLFYWSSIYTVCLSKPIYLKKKVPWYKYLINDIKNISVKRRENNEFRKQELSTLEEKEETQNKVKEKERELNEKEEKIKSKQKQGSDYNSNNDIFSN